MAEYIEREALIEWLKRIPLIDLSDGRGLCRVIMEDDFKKAIKKMPKGIIADVAPVRHGPCPYCDAKTNDFIPINQTVEYSGIEIALNRQGMLRVRVYESGQETFTAQDIVEIKCCPNCGAKMDGGAD